MLDRDGNGFISKQELGMAMRSLGYMPSEVELAIIMQRLDMDGETLTRTHTHAGVHPRTMHAHQQTHTRTHAQANTETFLKGERVTVYVLSSLVLFADGFGACVFFKAPRMFSLSNKQDFKPLSLARD